MISWGDLHLTLLSALTLGSYGFTLWAYQRLDGKIDTLLRNHVEHLEARVRQLEEQR